LIKWRGRKLISFVLLLTLVLSSINLTTFEASYANETEKNLTLKLNKTSDVDVVLAVGNSAQDVSNFENDLKYTLYLDLHSPTEI